RKSERCLRVDESRVNVTAFDIDRAGIGGARKVWPDRFDQAVANDHHALGGFGTTHWMNRSARDGVQARRIGQCRKTQEYRDQTLFFDFLPLDLGKIRGMRTKLQLYTVPGQVYYNSTRQLVLKGADGVVFVADSQESALDGNLESIQNLEDNMKRQGTKIRDV